MVQHTKYYDLEMHNRIFEDGCTSIYLCSKKKRPQEHEFADCEEVSLCTEDMEVVQAGITVSSMPESDWNEEYRRFAEDYGICFLFDESNPFSRKEAGFYPVPRIDLFATDGEGGFFATIGDVTDLDSAAPICHIDADRNVFLVAGNLREFIGQKAGWKKQRKPCDDIKIKLFGSKAEAMEKLEFVEVDTELLRTLKQAEK